jgi:hypothetical protein
MTSSGRSRPPLAPFQAIPKVSEMLSFRACLIAALVIFAGVFALYSPALDFQFILDDHRFIQDHRIQFAGYIWEYFTSFVWAQSTGAPPSFYRPVFLLWMRINIILCGLSSWGWHLLSIAKHALVATLLGFLVWKLLRDRTAALLASTLFVFHPAQVESVAWVTVPDPLMSAAILGALLCYLTCFHDRSANSTETRIRDVRSRKSGSNQRHSADHTTSLIAAAVCFLIALLAKETAIILPAVIFVLGLQNTTPVPDQGKARGLLERTVRTRLYGGFRQTLLFLFVTALYLLLRLNALGGVSSRTQHLPMSTVLLSWPKTLWFYCEVVFWPVHSHAFADPSIVSQFSPREVLLPMFGLLCGCGILAVLLLWAFKSSERHLPAEKAAGVKNALIIGTLLLILPILPTLDLNALNPGDFLHGRYTYLPLAGLMLLLATAWHLLPNMHIPCLVLASVLAAVFSVLTVRQEQQWRNDLTVFTIAHELAPRNAPVARSLADARVQQALRLEEEGRCKEALPVFQQVSREYPEDWYAWAALGDCQVQLNDYSQAEESLHRAADLSHDPRVLEQWQQLREHIGLPPANTK